jgi:hypothetical protein
MAERYFKRREAEELLPMIGQSLELARDRKREISDLDLGLTQAAAKIMVLGGSIPHYSELAKKRAERDSAASKLAELINKIQETGCVVKDLDEGLVDFPSLIKGKEAFLCWKLGEERIGYWHGIDEGYAGRKPLDETPPEEQPPPHGPRRVQ